MHFLRSVRAAWLLWGLLIVSLVFCSSRPTAAQPNAKAFQRVMEVQDRNTARLFEIDGVVGTATGVTPGGAPAVIVYTAAADVRGVPARLERTPVIVKVSGPIFALQGPPPGKGKNKETVDPTSRFEQPVPIGVSTGHTAITAGTIGCRVFDVDVAGNINYYALSNNHVYANSNAATIGDAVIQPGTFDGGSSPADDIGMLFDFQRIEFGLATNNVMDAAIALTGFNENNSVINSTPSDGYGMPKMETIVASVGMKVIKYGRTTGQTQGRVDAINATVNVNYGAPGVARFVDQIIITPGDFSAGGDSGSLVVVSDKKGKNEGDHHRKPVGLLFAGSPFMTIANPIDPVLIRFGVLVDGD